MVNIAEARPLLETAQDGIRQAGGLLIVVDRTHGKAKAVAIMQKAARIDLRLAIRSDRWIAKAKHCGGTSGLLMVGTCLPP
jgi:hypothetical protein